MDTPCADDDDVYYMRWIADDDDVYSVVMM